MVGNKYKATLILVVVSVGFLLSYPFQHTFMGGLLASGFRAAMIGGLADWFAVTALFRRPLGIPFRTAIVPRNREKIFLALAYMVEHEILMKENIKKRLAEYDLSVILLYLLDKQASRHDVRKMVYRFLQDFFLQIKTDELGVVIENFVEDNMENIKIFPYVTHISQWLIDQGYDDEMIDLIISQCIIAVQDEKFMYLLADIFVTVQKKYERGMQRRKLFNRLLDLSPKQLAHGAQHGLVVILIEMRTSHHPIRLEGKAWLRQFVVKLQTDEKFQQVIESWIQKNIIVKFRLGEHIANMMITVYGKNTANNRILVRGIKSLMIQLDLLIADFAQNHEERTKMDHYLKGMINGWIDVHHNEIGRIVKESLNKFTNEKLVNFIEKKFGNDLQMIRINGSVVGGLVGMMIYVITFWL